MQLTPNTLNGDTRNGSEEESRQKIRQSKVIQLKFRVMGICALLVRDECFGMPGNGGSCSRLVLARLAAWTNQPRTLRSSRTGMRNVKYDIIVYMQEGHTLLAARFIF